MKILIVHNRYRLAGGEDVVAQREAELLRSRGHDVRFYSRSNRELDAAGLLGRAAAPIAAIWSRTSFAELTGLLQAEAPDVVHVHNTHLMISPAVYFACNAAGVPVVQTLHNPRLMCPAGTLTRNGRLCTDCVGRSFAVPGIVHACYRDSRPATTMTAAVSSVHRLLKTWRERVDLYIASTAFYRRLFVRSGLPADRVVVKPHFVTPDPGASDADGRGYALFIGRLAAEKGIDTLLEAWRALPDVPLKIRGEGPLRPMVTDTIENDAAARIELIGRLDDGELVSLIRGAAFLVWPSTGFYETFGLVAVEAFACGRPVIASRIGVMSEIVADGETGLHFEAGNAADLVRKVRWALDHPAAMRRMGQAARRRFLERYTAEANHRMLTEIYESARLRGAARPRRKQREWFATT